MTGQPFAGRRGVRQGGVLFVAAEGAYEIPIRLQGLVKGKLAGLEFSQCASQPKPIDPKRLPIAWAEDCPALLSRSALETLAATGKAAAARFKAEYGLPLALIIIDTIAASAGYDKGENDAAEGNRVMQVLERLSRETGAFVLGVDHFGKAVETGTRGTSAKESAADVVLAMLGDRDIAGTVSNLRMALRKLRGGRSGMETPYTLTVVTVGENRDGDPITTCTVEWKLSREGKAEAAPKAERWPQSLRIFRNALNTALIEHGKAMRPFGSEGPEVRAAPQTRVRAEFVASYPAEGENEAKRTDAKRSAFNRALKRALDRGLIVSRDIGGIDHLWRVHDADKADIHRPDGPDTS
jgi:hypothetical protein